MSFYPAFFGGANFLHGFQGQASMPLYANSLLHDSVKEISGMDLDMSIVDIDLDADTDFLRKTVEQNGC